MNTSNSHIDSIDNLIQKIGLHIKSVDFQPELDLMTIYLNTKAVLTHQLSSYKLLAGAATTQLFQYELINGGIAIHWPLLDEDLSLKGFLQYELLKLVKAPMA